VTNNGVKSKKKKKKSRQCSLITQPAHLSVKRLRGQVRTGMVAHDPDTL
jgi:hypothetical protein